MEEIKVDSKGRKVQMIVSLPESGIKEKAEKESFLLFPNDPEKKYLR